MAQQNHSTNNYIIKPLCKETIAAATKLRDSVFECLSKGEIESLDASIKPNFYKKWYRKNKIDSLSYWVSIDKKDSAIVGIVGLYTETDSSADEIWLGWYCVDPKFRGCGIGSRLLSYAIDKAASINKQVIKLYTTDEQQHIDAIKLYERKGFRLIGKRRYKNTKVSKLWYELAI